MTCEETDLIESLREHVKMLTLDENVNRFEPDPPPHNVKKLKPILGLKPSPLPEN